MVTRKEQLFILTLGREITPYEAAQIITKKKPEDFHMGELGPWYNCKTELLEEGFVKEVPREGRSKPIKADLSLYIDLILKDKWEGEGYNEFKQQQLDLFEKHAARIVDFLLEHGSPEELDSIAYPFIFFLLCRMIASSNLDKKEADSKLGFIELFNIPEKAIENIIAFVDLLTDKERKELFQSDWKQFFLTMVKMLPASTFKKLFIGLFEKWFVKNES